MFVGRCERGSGRGRIDDERATEPQRLVSIDVIVRVIQISSGLRRLPNAKK